MCACQRSDDWHYWRCPKIAGSGLESSRDGESKLALYRKGVQRDEKVGQWK